MFIDYAEVKVISGKGGDGASSFRREKFVPKGGPDGGNGGKGGSVIFEADKQLSTLVDVHFKKTYRAKGGEKGKKSNMHGKNAEDFIVKVPCGTVIREKGTGNIIKDLVDEGERAVAAKGGKGGRGNATFKTSTRQAPRFYEKGEPGEEKEIVLELKVLADAGLIGIANAGKSTFLSNVSNAKPKVANYPFTTLAPVLGYIKISDTDALVIADIPGLIEGASNGRGLGTDFLRHIERIGIYIHIVDPTQGDALENFDIINNELKFYDEGLIKRPQVVAVNKCDLLTEKEKKHIKNEFLKRKIKPDFISARNGIGLEKIINKVYNKMKTAPKIQKTEKPGIEVKQEKIELKKLEKGVYLFENKKTEKYAAMLDFNNPETNEVFRRFLKREGIDNFLSQKGVKEGDIVVIGERDFVYREE